MLINKIIGRKMKCEDCIVMLAGLDVVEHCACCENWPHHRYAEIKCSACGKVFCYSCCGGTNVDQGGGKHEEDFMLCPSCGKDCYQ